MKGGIGIGLSPLAIVTWKLAGQPEPIRPGKIAGATRVMVLELHFRDNDEELLNSPVGRHGNPHRNDNGDKLRDFMNNHGLCSIPAFFKK
jgi:hypothetical protein